LLNQTGFILFRINKVWHHPAARRRRAADIFETGRAGLLPPVSLWCIQLTAVLTRQMKMNCRNQYPLKAYFTSCFSQSTPRPFLGWPTLPSGRRPRGYTRLLRAWFSDTGQAEGRRCESFLRK